MARRQKQARFTQCFVTAPRPVSLNDRRITQALFCFIVLSLLGVGHIYLGFSINDMKLQHMRLQEKQRALLQNESRLQHEKEALCDMERLLDRARYDLGMQEVDPRERQVALVPAVLQERYAVPTDGARALAAARVRDDIADQASGVKQFLFSVIAPNKAYAAGSGE